MAPGVACVRDKRLCVLEGISTCQHCAVAVVMMVVVVLVVVGIANCAAVLLLTWLLSRCWFRLLRLSCGWVVAVGVVDVFAPRCEDRVCV